MPPITVRNLSPNPLTLVTVERYEAPTPEKFQPNAGFSVNNIGGSVNNLTQGFSQVMSNVTRGGGNGNGGGGNKHPNNAQLGEKAKTFKKEDVDVRLEPYTTHKTQIKASDRGPKEILRLTFKGEGPGKWRIDVPTPSAASQKLVPLGPNPAKEYTGIYNGDSSFLAILESTNLRKWMKAFKDDTPLSALSIPGTHNSPTCHTALPSVRCQAVGPEEQLQNGVRFFDIRVQPNGNGSIDEDLQLVHGSFPISLTGPKRFRGLVKEVLEFLKENPSETVIISLKREGGGNTNDEQLAQIMKQHYVNPNDWYTRPVVPKLGEARGKIILMRRFKLPEPMKKLNDGKGWALNAQNWAYNTPNCHHGDVQVQDFCEVLDTENIDHKIKVCCEHFERAGAVTHPTGPSAESQDSKAFPLYLNFLSASNFWKVGCWPDKIAAKLNPAVVKHLCERHDIGDKGVEGPGQEVKGDGGVGIVVTDWVGEKGDWDLVRCIVGMNGKLLLRQRE